MARQYFWLYGKPIYWSIKDMKIGEEEEFTLYNSSGNKRRIFNCFVNAREGDLVVGYQSAPVAQIIALFRVSHEVENPDDINATIGFEKLLDIPEGITKQDLIDHGLGDMSPMRNSQGSIFPLSAEEFRNIATIIEEHNAGIFDSFPDIFVSKSENSGNNIYKRKAQDSRILNKDTKVMSAFSEEELLEMFGLDTLAPRLYIDDNTVILLEGEGVKFNWQSSIYLLIDYELTSTNRLTHQFKLRRDLELPETALILNKESEKLYRFMGEATLSILNTKAIRKSWKSYTYIATVEAVIKVDDKKEINIEELKEKYGDMDPKTMEQVVTTFYRSPEVAEYAKKSANGICQLCGNPAPFIDRNGEPYLESHHVIWLSRGGTDTPDNVVGLCPNCHSKMHAIDDPIDIGNC